MLLLRFHLTIYHRFSGRSVPVPLALCRKAVTSEKNTALYEKMAAEQDAFRDWLKSQYPEEVLNHTYEYTIREDIVMATAISELH